MAFFPMFVDICDKSCLVIGGGQVAYEKIKVLKDFGAKVTIVSPTIDKNIKELPEISFLEREFHNDDINGMFIVVAATNDKCLNAKIGKLCLDNNTHVNVVDNVAICSFTFPAYVKEGDVVAGFSSGGKSPLVSKYLKDNFKLLLNPKISAINSFLGEIRPKVQKEIINPKKRKKVYSTVFDYFMKYKHIPKDEYLDNIINDINKEGDDI